MAKRLRLRGGQGLDALKLVDDPIPSPEHDEVVIEMRAAGLNRSEWLYINGEYIINTVDPSNVGTEGSGIVHSVGPEAIGVAVGDEVCVLPTFLPDEYGVIAEFALVPSSALSPKPRRLTFEQAAAVWMAFATAYAALVTKGGLGAEATPSKWWSSPQQAPAWDWRQSTSLLSSRPLSSPSPALPRSATRSSRQAPTM